MIGSQQLKRFRQLISIALWPVIFVLMSACNTEQSATSTHQQTADQSQPGMVLIPAGEFIMGSDDIDASGKSTEFGFNEPWYLPEHPQHKVNLKAYWMDKYEVTNAQFKDYLLKSGAFSDEQLQDIYGRLQMKVDAHPVRVVTWFKAEDYCRSVGKRLPSEAEWEKAARGVDGREYPWGNEWQPEYLNAGQNEQDLTPVGHYEKGQSPFGVYDMAGNVMEWTADWYQPYPGNEYQSKFFGQTRKVVRGGSWGGVGHYVIAHYFRTAYRYDFPPDQAFNDVGFRCAKDIK